MPLKDSFNLVFVAVSQAGLRYTMGISMERKEMYEKIKQAICSVLRKEVSFEGVTEDTDIIEAFSLNSIVAIELVVRMETIFDIEIEDEDLSTELFKTLRTIADYVEKKLVIMNE